MRSYDLRTKIMGKVRLVVIRSDGRGWCSDEPLREALGDGVVSRIPVVPEDTLRDAVAGYTDQLVRSLGPPWWVLLKEMNVACYDENGCSSSSERCRTASLDVPSCFTPDGPDGARDRLHGLIHEWISGAYVVVIESGEHG